jgi:YgiT-type zinc finger domain-containing protein
VNLTVGELVQIVIERIARESARADAAEKRVRELEAALKDEALAFNHANEVVGKLERDLDAPLCLLCGATMVRTNGYTGKVPATGVSVTIHEPGWVCPSCGNYLADKEAERG